jgi:hypothetical protein
MTKILLILTVKFKTQYVSFNILSILSVYTGNPNCFHRKAMYVYNEISKW